MSRSGENPAAEMRAAKCLKTHAGPGLKPESQAARYIGLANRRLQPLGHLSGRGNHYGFGLLWGQPPRDSCDSGDSCDSWVVTKEVATRIFAQAVERSGEGPIDGGSEGVFVHTRDAFAAVCRAGVVVTKGVAKFGSRKGYPPGGVVRADASRINARFESWADKSGCKAPRFDSSRTKVESQNGGEE